MFWVVIEDEGLFYYWAEFKTVDEACDEFIRIRKEYPHLFPLVVREGQVEVEEEDCWALRDFY